MSVRNRWGNALNWYMMAPFHLRNTICSTTTRNSFAVWRTLRAANLANETAVRERLDNNNGNGDSWCVYSVSGWGVSSDCTVLVPVDDRKFD